VESGLDIKKSRKWSMLTAEKLLEIVSFIERSPRKSLTYLSALSGMSVGFVHTAGGF
jgi:hypothetical protein